MSNLVRFAAIVGLLFAGSGSVHAFGWGFSTSTSAYYPSYYYSGYYYPYYTTSYYPAVSYSYYVPSYAHYVPAYAFVCPEAVTVKPSAPSRPKVSTFATPTPAPPSQTHEPPLNSQQSAPKVKEKHSFYNAAAAMASNQTTPQGSSKVGFWNMSKQSVTLQINGQSYQLPANRGMTLLLPRQFVWKMNQQPAQVATIPANRESYEIVLR